MVGLFLFISMEEEMEEHCKNETGTKETERLIGVAELADLLAVPPSWVYSRTRTKTIPFVRVGKYCRFRYREVLNHLEK